jgi:aryl-alcohol dehydrogenase-like predicted oxidoreductase
VRYVENLGTATPYSVIGLGCWQFGGDWGYGEEYEKEAAQIVARARELGVTFFDTAEVYGRGRSEKVLGAALRETGGTDGVVVASKILPVLPTAPVVQQRGVASAQRLGVRTIDLYQVHMPNPVVNDGTTMRGMKALQDVGIVRDVGVSNYKLARWQSAEARLGSKVLSNQVKLNLVHRDPLAEMLPWAQRTGHVVIAYSPLAQGLLSGRYDRDHRPSNALRANSAMFLPENLDAATPLLDTLRDVASAHDATPSQVALAWVVHQPHVVAIPGASSVAQLESNCAAAEITLSAGEYAGLTAAAEAYQPLTGIPAIPKLVASRRRS